MRPTVPVPVVDSSIKSKSFCDKTLTDISTMDNNEVAEVSVGTLSVS